MFMIKSIAERERERERRKLKNRDEIDMHA